MECFLMNAVREQEECSKLLKPQFTATKIFSQCVISYSFYASNNLYLFSSLTKQ